MQEQNEDWSADQIADEASQQERDQIHRQIKRGDETQGDPDNRDDAGTIDSDETWQGREEAKTQVENNEEGAEKGAEK